MTTLVHCPLCRALVRVKVASRRVGTDQHGRPVVEFKVAPVTHRCDIAHPQGAA